MTGSKTCGYHNCQAVAALGKKRCPKHLKQQLEYTRKYQTKQGHPPKQWAASTEIKVEQVFTHQNGYLFNAISLGNDNLKMELLSETESCGAVLMAQPVIADFIRWLIKTFGLEVEK